MGLSVPAMAAFAAVHRPEGGGGNYGSASGGYDQLGFGSLTFTRDPLPATGPANGTYKIFARHSSKAMEVANNGTANGSNVRQWISNDCTCQQWQLIPLSTTSARMEAVTVSTTSTEVTVFPNPSTGNVTVTLPHGSSIITLTDLTGRVLYRVVEKDNRHILDMSGKAPGIYFITITNGDKQVTKKIVR